MKKQGRVTAPKGKAVTHETGGNVHMKRVNFQIPADQHTKLKVYAAQHGKTITELLTEHVEQLVDE
ncbi:TPA: chromosome partitioning protein ParB [Burkholderia multivorans]|nr:chromosome partitioning protein ParB [Burkholderia multivorans]HEM7816841.1 chromosome partitioning protein ParB [Burkholderia multivorans]HEM7822271.1 chromosome partitioning protein ParB [Burkholderia multivorans]HEM7828266.1 chromosome partitioning protein ParB [Burkholderia multivorans]